MGGNALRADHQKACCPIARECFRLDSNEANRCCKYICLMIQPSFRKANVCVGWHNRGFEAGIIEVSQGPSPATLLLEEFRPLFSGRRLHHCRSRHGAICDTGIVFAAESRIFYADLLQLHWVHRRSSSWGAGRTQRARTQWSCDLVRR